MTKIVNLYQAKTQLSQLVKEASAGEEIIIAKGGKPAARLVALAVSKQPRKPGGWEGQVWMAEDFDEEVSVDELGAWYGQTPLIDRDDSA
ncbi:MAG: type II toxin-antitoxin system prevent-host-death family antitoxin [Gemmatimonas sp.]|nr:type II toxin-antitoxin system prevent-host-death family antitoxin [Gemmatimonas sp.]